MCHVSSCNEVRGRAKEERTQQKLNNGVSKAEVRHRGNAASSCLALGEVSVGFLFLPASLNTKCQTVNVQVVVYSHSHVPA